MNFNTRRITFLLLIAVVSILSSCVNGRKVVYFQKGMNGPDTVKLASAYVSKIQSGDILSIYVNSLSSDASSFFNPYSGQQAQSSDASGALSASVAPGFLVNQSGVIQLPLIGNVEIAGLTTNQATVLIQSRLTKFLKEPTVNIRVLNYKVSMLGEVSKPGVYVIPNEQVTIPEALSMAGDLAVTGRRDNIMIIREVNGKKEFGYVDLTSRDVFQSPYYYLHANDVVYVEPVKNKFIQTNFTYRILPLIIGIVSAVLIIFTRLR
ncbi:polysaccharide biosynthesis/export family protein [Mucilaginibacter galii]|nr:polysaccharide biosynthesis/export family protein [Mucilaginibacter galii]